MNDTLMEFAWAKLSLPSILFVTIGNVKLIKKSDMCQPKINGIMTIVIYLGKISVAPNSGSDNGECKKNENVLTKKIWKYNNCNSPGQN